MGARTFVRRELPQRHRGDLGQHRGSPCPSRRNGYGPSERPSGVFVPGDTGGRSLHGLRATAEGYTGLVTWHRVWRVHRGLGATLRPPMATGRNQMESAELLRRIRDELCKRPKVPDSEWKTARQWGTVWGLGISQTNKMLLHGIESGLMEMQRFRISTPTRGTYPIPHYRCVSPTNPSLPSKSK